MNTMKMFLKYLILFLLLYVFVNIISYGAIKTSYNNVTDYNINFTEPEVTISEAKATRVNGYVKGTIKNSTSESIKNKYIKIDFITKNNNTIVSKYIDIYGLNAQESKDFNIKYDAEGITKFNMSIAEEKEKTNENIWQKVKYILAGGLLVYILIGK